MAFGKAKPPVDTAWRPDFKMSERLPDIKPVRTDFFINFAALTFVLFAVVLMVIQELTIFNANSDIDRKVSELKNKTSEQEEFSKNDVAFAKHATFLKDFILFSNKQLSASDLLLLFSRDTPNDITLESIRQLQRDRDKITVTSIEVSGYVRVPDTTKANAVISQYLQILFKSPELKGKNVSHTLNPQDFVRDQERSVVKFKALIEISPAPVVAPKPLPATE